MSNDQQCARAQIEIWEVSAVGSNEWMEASREITSVDDQTGNSENSE